MTMQRDAVDHVLGLAGTFPRPGWVVLDAARDLRFTGELLLETSPPSRVYLDRGTIYLAERSDDPSIGARLVDNGALTAVQLERGAVRIGEIEHLGRLFDRVPTLDRHAVVVAAELMTEERVGWIAAQRVDDVTTTPYRHHESGMQHWAHQPSWGSLTPGDPLPAPRLDEAPVPLAAPEPTGAGRASRTEPFLDGLLEWQEPAWFDDTRLELELDETAVVSDAIGDLTIDVPGTDPAIDAPTVDAASEPTLDAAEVPTIWGSLGDDDDATEDWVDRLVTDGLPDDDGLGSATTLPRLPIEPADRFELIWPSGDVDEQFGAVDSVVGDGHDPDADRVGATARLVRAPFDPDAQVAAGPDDHPTASLDTAPTGDDDDQADEVVLAVRRAVASIEVGSLAARQRLADSGPRSGPGGGGVPTDAVGATGVPAPGRVAVRSGRNDWTRRTVSRSVFDEPATHADHHEPTPATPQDDGGERRSGALRRLISALRR